MLLLLKYMKTNIINENKVMDLQNRWNLTIKSFNLLHENDFKYIIEAYSQPYRTYHNLTHLEHCFNTLDIFFPAIHNCKQIEFALWFHDIIYDLKDSIGSVQRSADFAAMFLSNSNFFEEFIEKVRILILATKHTEIPSDRDQQIVTDIDLSILGSTPRIFDIYEMNIRKEYYDVSDNDWRIGRMKFLYSLIEYPIFYTLEISIYENQARSNILRTIEKLNDHEKIA
jgi:predicted metal-dependent HD superfamily phosphohydrolase